MSDQPVVYELPVLPLKNAVLFPYLLMPLSAGRPGSVAGVEAALATESKEVLVFTQRDGDVDSPLQDDLHPIGTKAVIRKMSRSGEGHLELLVLGMERVALVKLDFEKRWYVVTDRSLRVREGIAFVREATVTFAKIQNISMSQGPVQRALGMHACRGRTPCATVILAKPENGSFATARPRWRSSAWPAACSS